MQEFSIWDLGVDVWVGPKTLQEILRRTSSQKGLFTPSEMPFQSESYKFEDSDLRGNQNVHEGNFSKSLQVTSHQI